MQALIIGIAVYCFGFFVLPWMNEFSRPRGELMIGYSAMSFMAGVTAPLVGMLIDKYSKRALVLTGTVSYALGLFLISRAQAPWFIVSIFGLILPVAMSLAGPLMAQTLVANAFEKNRGTALGICSLGTSIGGFTMPVLVTGLLDIYEWRQVFVILAAIIAVGMVPLVLLVLKPNHSSAAPKATNTESLGNKNIFGDSNIYKLALAFFVPSFMFIGVLQNMGLFAADLQLSLQQAGWVVSVSAGLMAVGKFVVGWLADRASHRAIYNTIIIFVGLSLYLTATANHFVVLVIAVAALGTSVGGMTPLFGAIVSQRYGMDNFGRVMGVVMGTASLSGLAPLVAGWLRDSTGSYETTFLWFLPMIVPAIIAFNRLSNAPQNKPL
jgi:MFS family permease